MDHALQNLIEKGIWVRGRLLNTLVTFGKIWVSWHSAASEHNMHQRLSSNSLNCILMSWWLWRLFLNQIGALELHLVLIKLMHLLSSNVLREWKRDTKRILFCLALSQGLSFLILWRVYKPYRVKDYQINHRPKPQCRPVYWALTIYKETCILVWGWPLVHCVSLEKSDKSQLFSNSADNQNSGGTFTMQISKCDLTSRSGCSPGISVLIIFSRRFLWVGCNMWLNHPNHNFLLCKTLLAWITS